jgi:demethylmenaquinone methyltransferase/2-methoxy-6-polyprenyl-1,4-benzoquinol methylase
MSQVSEAAVQESRQGRVNDVFARAAMRYDQMNDLMSGGLHRLWKDDFVAGLNLKAARRPVRCLDVAGGTGDIALRMLAEGGERAEVVVADISAPMAGQGRERIHAQDADRRCRFIVCDAAALAFPDCHFDCYTIAFGIRNVARIEEALQEAYRVLKPGGRFACLEFSRPHLPGLASLYDAYSLTVIPALGKLVTGDGAPYRYLVESIRAFPGGGALASMMHAAGFSRVKFRDLTGGIVAIHSGWRL